jgi:hypothetical protein
MLIREAMPEAEKKANAKGFCLVRSRYVRRHRADDLHLGMLGVVD